MKSQDSRMSRDGVYGGLRHELSNRPIVEMSPSVTGVVLFPFPGGNIRGVEISVSELGGKTLRVSIDDDLPSEYLGSMSAER